jgi:hypothetical protein
MAKKREKMNIVGLTNARIVGLMNARKENVEIGNAFKSSHFHISTFSHYLNNPESYIYLKPLVLPFVVVPNIIKII